MQRPSTSCACPASGFASTEQGNALTAGEQRAKLELIARVADEGRGC